jgi:multiple sugar transport system permease protein
VKCSVLLVAVPFFLALSFSVADVTTASPPRHFVGLDNFRAAWDDPVFQQSLRNTAIMTAVTMAIVVVLAHPLSLLLAANIRGRRLLRFFVLLPWTTPVPLAAIAWLWLLDNLFSPIDWILRHLHLLEDWLGRPDLARGSVIAVQVCGLSRSRPSS